MRKRSGRSDQKTTEEMAEEMIEETTEEMANEMIGETTEEMLEEMIEKMTGELTEEMTGRRGIRGGIELPWRQGGGVSQIREMYDSR